MKNNAEREEAEENARIKALAEKNAAKQAAWDESEKKREEDLAYEREQTIMRQKEEQIANLKANEDQISKSTAERA